MGHPACYYTVLYGIMTYITTTPTAYVVIRRVIVLYCTVSGLYLYLCYGGHQACWNMTYITTTPTAYGGHQACWHRYMYMYRYRLRATLNQYSDQY